jgi:hypothetical protein
MYFATKILKKFRKRITEQKIRTSFAFI